MIWQAKGEIVRQISGLEGSRLLSTAKLQSLFIDKKTKTK
jgi:hypothetical protein